MSCCSCVVPVDWDILWGRVVPGWLDVLSGVTTQREFYDEFVPLGNEDAQYIMGLDQPLRTPEGYLSLFKHASDEPVLASAVAGTLAYADFAKSVDCFDSTFLLSLAIKHSAAVDLPGPDAFADDLWLAHLTEPRVQVVGTKNDFKFLEIHFEQEWKERDGNYRYRRKAGRDPAFQQLLEFLFLYVRAFPGSWIHAPSSCWPGSDDYSIAGYLSPAEVRALSQAIRGWTENDNDGWNPAELFVDRVVRAAESQLGLITLHAGLS